MIETKSFLDIKPSVEGLSAFQTHDGVWLVTHPDPEIGTVSAASQAEAEHEIRRREAALRRKAA